MELHSQRYQSILAQKIQIMLQKLFIIFVQILASETVCLRSLHVRFHDIGRSLLGDMKRFMLMTSRHFCCFEIVKNVATRLDKLK